MEPIRELDMDALQTVTNEDLRPLKFGDYKKATSKCKPTVCPNDIAKYELWNKTYGTFENIDPDT